MKKGKLFGFLRWLFTDPRPEIHENHSATREAMLTPCGAYRCPGANDQLCEACRANPAMTGARHA